jgi:molybdopterin/thiamine biosynthesis adenylyltransferase
MSILTIEQEQRYRRNILLDEVGEAGQVKLLQARVLLIGVGGLGSPVALYLAAAGVGTLGIADNDTVDITNLQRQVIYSTRDIGMPKVESAAVKLRALNPDITIVPQTGYLDESTLAATVAHYDFVIDATDNIASKLAINDACVKAVKPFCHAGIYRFSGEVMTVVPPATACYRCAFGNETPAVGGAPAAPVAGPLGPVAGLAGCIQATECLKYLLGMTDLLTDTLLVIDTISMSFRKAGIRKRENCRACGRENGTRGKHE